MRKRDASLFWENPGGQSPQSPDPTPRYRRLRAPVHLPAIACGCPQPARESNLVAKIDRLGTKLTKFEESEIDKRKQLEVRVAALEKHLGIEKKIAA